MATAGLIVNWFGDSLDGTVARFRKIERPRYGFFIDHTTDLFSEVFFALGLGLSPYVRFEVGLANKLADYERLVLEREFAKQALTAASAGLDTKR